MHRLTAIFLIFLYTVAMLRPISPFIEYALNYEYISEILCINKENTEMNCDGKCYLTKELNKQSEENKTNATLINLEEYPIGFIHIISLEEEQLIKERTTKNTEYCKNYHLLISKNFFRPPKIA